MTRAEFLALPNREWDKKSTYDSLYLIPTRKKHDSGYMTVALIGVRGVKAVEIAAQCCDDIEWVTTPDSRSFRMDCEYPSGILHPWGHGLQFTVGTALSSTTVTVSRKEK